MTAIDHRRVQRTLFRMQVDPRFAAAFFARDRAALASTGLGPREISLLAALDPVAVEADREGARRAQFLRNVAAEFELSAAVAGVAPALGELFAASPEFHAAAAEGARFSAAFAALAARVARQREDRLLAAIAALEAELARARRAPPREIALAAGEVALAPRASLATLPAGTLDAAVRVRAALDARAQDAAATPPGDAVAVSGLPVDGAAAFAGTLDDGGATETILVLARDRGPHRLADVEPERLEPAVADLLRAAEKPLARAARDAFARARGVDPDDVEAFVADLLADGVLVSAPASARR